MLRRMRVLTAIGAAVALALTPAAAAAHGDHHKRNPRSIKLQNEFDHIGAEVHSLTRDGRTSYYIDEGRPGRRAVVFIGGAGNQPRGVPADRSSRARAARSSGCASSRSSATASASRALDLNLGYADYNAEVLAVLDHLGIDRFAIVAISGGGAYAAHLAAAVPDRVISLHAAAADGLDPAQPRAAQLHADLRAAQRGEPRSGTPNPKVVVGRARAPRCSSSPAGRRPPTSTRCARSTSAAGSVDPSPLSHEGDAPLPGRTRSSTRRRSPSPTYLYWGGADTTRAGQRHGALAGRAAQRRQGDRLPRRGPHGAVPPLGPDPGRHGRLHRPDGRLPATGRPGPCPTTGPTRSSHAAPRSGCAPGRRRAWTARGGGDALARVWCGRHERSSPAHRPLRRRGHAARAIPATTRPAWSGTA